MRKTPHLFCAKFLFVFICAGTLGMAYPAWAQNNFAAKAPKKLAALPAPQTQLELGEHLMYEVSWMGVPVGYGELWVKEKINHNGRDVFHVVAIARTNEVLSTIYPVVDELHSYIDVNDLYPVEFRKQLSEGRYRADEKTSFDPEKKKGYYESLKNGEKKEFEIGGYVHDVISAFFWVRRQILEPGKSVRTIVSSEEKDHDLEVQVLRREQKEIKGRGSVDTLLVEPKTSLKGVLYSRGRVWIYLSADAKRIPIWIMLKTPFGPINGVLKTQSKK